MDGESPAEEIGELRREVRYLRSMVEQTASRSLMTDMQSIAIRHELEQKRRGFRLMAELAVTLRQDFDFESVFVSISRRVNATLNMQRTAVLLPEEDGLFRAKVLQGYLPEEQELLAAKRIPVDAELLDPLHPTLITGADPASRQRLLRKTLKIPCLIASPVILHNGIVALLITGRLMEQRPFLPRLGASDVETVQTVGTYLAAMLAGHRLRQAESQANHDPLTKLPNLRGATEHLRRILALARRGGFIVAVMFIDLDNFKIVNDANGHAAGDIVLQAAAERLTHCVRGSDFIGRIGGDEFLAILTNIRSPQDAEVVAGKILAKISEPIIISDGVAAKIGASIGISLYPLNGSDGASLIRSADEAMYAVKNKGKRAFAFAGV